MAGQCPPNSCKYDVFAESASVTKKVMSHKEKKELKKRQKMEAEMERITKKGGEGHSALGDNFTVAQALKTGARQLAQLEIAMDIKVDKFSIAAKGKDLFRDASLSISAGRRYGLVCPNGHGKTTLLRHIGSRSLQIPPNIDVLYCEQEVVATDMSALETVLASDEKRNALMKELKELEKQQEKVPENYQLAPLVKLRHRGQTGNFRAIYISVIAGKRCYGEID